MEIVTFYLQNLISISLAFPTTCITQTSKQITYATSPETYQVHPNFRPNPAVQHTSTGNSPASGTGDLSYPAIANELSSWAPDVELTSHPHSTPALLPQDVVPSKNGTLLLTHHTIYHPVTVISIKNTTSALPPLLETEKLSRLTAVATVENMQPFVEEMNEIYGAVTSDTPNEKSILRVKSRAAKITSTLYPTF